jgi:hypothetical protein
MTDAVTIQLIDAAKVIIPSAISAWAAVYAVRAAKSAADAKIAVDHVAHAMNSILDQSRKDAKELGTAEGTAVGVEKERVRQEGHPAE